MSWMGVDQGCELAERRSMACTSLLESPAMTSRLSTQIAVGWGIGGLRLFWTAHTFHSLRALVELVLLPAASFPNHPSHQVSLQTSPPTTLSSHCPLIPSHHPPVRSTRAMMSAQFPESKTVPGTEEVFSEYLLTPWSRQVQTAF